MVQPVLHSQPYQQKPGSSNYNSVVVALVSGNVFEAVWLSSYLKRLDPSSSPVNVRSTMIYYYDKYQNPDALAKELKQNGQGLDLIVLSATGGCLQTALKSAMAIRRLRAYERTGIVAIGQPSGRPEAERQREEFLKAGVKVYVPINASRTTMKESLDYLLRGIKAASSNEQFFPSMGYIQKARNLFSYLTPREVAILGYISEGRRNKEIAEIMEITPKIVKIQVSSIKRKLNIGSRTSLAVYALREGLAKLPEPDHETEHSIDDLTEREREIFQLVIVGKSNEEINADLSISQRTVRRHIEHIMKKLEVHRRIGLLSFASHEPLEANQIT